MKQREEQSDVSPVKSSLHASKKTVALDLVYAEEEKCNKCSNIIVTVKESPRFEGLKLLHIWTVLSLIGVPPIGCLHYCLLLFFPDVPPTAPKYS